MQAASARGGRVVGVRVRADPTLHQHFDHGDRRREIEGVVLERLRSGHLGDGERLAVHDERCRLPRVEADERIAVDLVFGAAGRATQHGARTGR
jgi:hypothetical protein